MSFDHRAYQKARRDKARSEGKCVQCCKRPVAPGKARCDDCLDWQARWQVGYLGRAELGRHCTSCNEHGHDRRCCPYHVEWYVAPSKGPWCEECLASGFHRAECSRAKEAA